MGKGGSRGGGNHSLQVNGESGGINGRLRRKVYFIYGDHSSAWQRNREKHPTLDNEYVHRN